MGPASERCSRAGPTRARWRARSRRPIRISSSSRASRPHPSPRTSSAATSQPERWHACARARSADIAPTVSPDGNLIAYFAIPRPARLDPDVPPPPDRIHVMSVDGGDDHALTPRGQSSIDPDWSPDGTRIAYVQTRFVGPNKDRPQNRLAIMNADGSDRHAITAYGGASEVNPKWAPDGLSIVFEQLRQRGNRSDIAAISPDGGPVRKILATKAWETNPVPSPDGTRIVFTSDRDRRGPERLNPGFEIYTMADRRLGHRPRHQQPQARHLPGLAATALTTACARLSGRAPSRGSAPGSSALPSPGADP